jgi:hypothetical protein
MYCFLSPMFCEESSTGLKPWVRRNRIRRLSGIQAECLKTTKAAVCVGAARPTNQIDHVCSVPTEDDVPVIWQARAGMWSVHEYTFLPISGDYHAFSGTNHGFILACLGEAGSLKTGDIDYC